MTARQLAETVSRVTGLTYKLLRGGGLQRLGTLISLTKAIAPGADAVYPPWQGMQYIRSMFSGLGKLQPLDNARYPDMTWTTVEEVLTSHYGPGLKTPARAKSAEVTETPR